jgi:tRNA nucleotidyltransferase (CCA-adding enzyme)
VVDGEIERLDPDQRWQWLQAGLMAPHPGNYLLVLNRCGGLARLLPEVSCLFGVPQLSDAAVPIDVGMHQIRFVDETAAVGAPLAVRFAALMHKIGKGGTPREIWPSHYKHEVRAHALLDQLPARIAVPAEPMQLARLVIDECERVHRASNRRAGGISLLLSRLGVERDRERFEQLLCVCTCDYAAHEGHRAAEYPKAPRLRRALDAYLGVPVAGLSEDAASEARAQAVAQALGSFMQA